MRPFMKHVLVPAFLKERGLNLAVGASTHNALLPVRGFNYAKC